MATASSGVLTKASGKDSDGRTALVRKATERPKRRIPTKVSANQKRKRVAAKKKHGEVKALRGRVDPEG
jgi:ribosome-associated protein